MREIQTKLTPSIISYLPRWQKLKFLRIRSVGKAVEKQALLYIASRSEK